MVPHSKGAIGTAANFLFHVADLMAKDGSRPAAPVAARA
jgi:hypothetical protein